MTSRPRLLTSIPFWILIVGSVVAGGVGLWIATDKLGTMERGLVDGTATTAQVYGGQSWSVIGGILLGAGVVGLLLALALAAAKSLIPQPEVAVVESIDWTSDDEAGLEPVSAPTAAPVIAEDPDVEVPSTATAPVAAHDEPVIATGDDDKRV
jgi:hypothetical protein